MTGLTTGQTYHFRSKAHNLHGWGALSSQLTVVSSAVPDQPAQATVEIVNQNIKIEWVEPFDNHASINGYIVTIGETASEVFTEEADYCE